MSTYAEWLPSLLPSPLAGRWGRAYARAMGLPVDTILDAAKDAVDQLGPADCPDDGLPAHGWARGIVQLSGEAPDRYRRRLVGAWESWKQAGRKPSIRAALNGYGLNGVSIYTTAELPWGGSPEWAWFTVGVSGYVGAGEAEVDGFDVGEVHPEGAGLGITPLLVGQFNVGQWVVGITATPATVASIRTAITTWKATRDRCVAVVFTWADVGPLVALRGHDTFDGGIMAATLVPNAQYDTGAMVIAENGELWSDEDGPAPFQVVFQRIADRLLFARDALIGALDWNGELSCAGGTASSFEIAVGAINAVVVKSDTDTYYTRSSAGAVVTESAIEGGGDLAVDQWYYLYLYRSGGGSLAYELSLTAPGVSRRFKSGDATRRYLGCLRTNAAGTPMPFVALRGRYVYRRSAVSNVNTGSGLRLLQRTTAQSSTIAVDISARIPPHARVAILRAEAVVTTADDAELFLYTAATDPSAHAQVRAKLAAADYNTRTTIETEIPVLQAPTAIAYALQVDTTSGSVLEASIHALGWVE